MVHVAPEVLARLVALACYQDDIPSLRRRKRDSDCSGTVGIDERLGTMRTARYFLDDRQRFFASWVVGGDDHDISKVARDTAHERAV